MFALLDIRLTPLTVLLGQEMCCKSLKITSPDRICHFVITKTTTGSWKVILLTRKQHCENVSLFLNLCYKKIPQHESFLSQLHLQMTEKCGGVFCSERWKLDTHRVWKSEESSLVLSILLVWAAALWIIRKTFLMHERFTWILRVLKALRVKKGGLCRISPSESTLTHHTRMATLISGFLNRSSQTSG